MLGKQKAIIFFIIMLREKIIQELLFKGTPYSQSASQIYYNKMDLACGL